MVSKKEEGKFRLIHHLSYPSGSSGNDGINKEVSRVQYATFDKALQLIRSAGQLRNHTLLELFPIIVTIELWGERLGNRQVVFWSDNMSVVQVANQHSARSPSVVSLLCFLVMRCLQVNIWFKAKDVPGIANDIADALSCSQFSQLSLPGSVGIPGGPSLSDLFVKPHL